MWRYLQACRAILRYHRMMFFLRFARFTDSFPNLKKIYQYYVERVDLQFMWNDHLKEIKVTLNVLFGKGPVESIMILSLATLCTKAPSENWFKIRKQIAKLMISKEGMCYKLNAWVQQAVHHAFFFFGGGGFVIFWDF